MSYVYVPIIYWCNTHQRRATYMRQKLSDEGNLVAEDIVCDPKLGGSMLSCDVVDLTGKALLENETVPRTK